MLITNHVNELKKEIQQILPTTWRMDQGKATKSSLHNLVAEEVVVSDFLNEIKQWNK